MNIPSRRMFPLFSRHCSLRKWAWFALIVALAGLFGLGCAMYAKHEDEVIVARSKMAACVDRVEKVANLCKDPFVVKMMGAK